MLNPNGKKITIWTSLFDLKKKQNINYCIKISLSSKKSVSKVKINVCSNRIDKNSKNTHTKKTGCINYKFNLHN